MTPTFPEEVAVSAVEPDPDLELKPCSRAPSGLTLVGKSRRQGFKDPELSR